MRNLKRALSLALASVMVLGLMIVGTSAASKDFADGSEIEYTEAVDVMNAIGVLEGDETGHFNPTDTLNREQAAKIIASMLLGPDNADKLGKNETIFTDVAKGSWAAGYISYCSGIGILVGDGTGRFLPQAELTGVAFGKMLLMALGYDADIEHYTGSDWSVNVASDMVDAGIDVDGVTFSDPLTREQAAQMAFNTLTADMVTYDQRGVQIGDVTIGASKAEPVANNKSSYKESDYTAFPTALKENFSDSRQFCEKYFPKLSLDDETPDEFGRPTDKWTYDKDEVGKYDTDDAVVTYTAEVDKDDVKADLKGYTVNIDDKTLAIDKKTTSTPKGTTGTKVAVDGADDVELADGSNNDLTKKTPAELIAALTGNGTVVEIYAEKKAIDKIVVINTYLVQADDDYDEDKGELSIALVSKDTEGTKLGSIKTIDADDFAIVKSVEDEDYLLVTIADDEIQSVAKAETVTASVTRYTTKDDVTAGGTKYSYSAKIKDDDVGYAKGYTIGDDSVFILDSYGYVIGTDDVAGSSDYVYVKEFGDDGRFADKKNVADAFFPDGTRKSIYLDDVVDDAGTAIEDKQLPSNTGWFTYTVKNDVYDLTKVATASQKSGNLKGAGSATADVYKNGSVTFESGLTNLNGVRANQKTVFIVLKDKAVTAYTGINNAPTIKTGEKSDETAQVDVSASIKDGYANYVFIDATKGSTSGATTEKSDVVYILSVEADDVKEGKDEDENTYAIFKAIVNGKETTITGQKKTTFSKAGLYMNVEYDEDGYVETAELVSKKDDDHDYKEYKGKTDYVTYGGGVLTIGPKGTEDDYVLADDCQIFVIDTQNENDVTTPSAEKLAKDYAETNFNATVTTVIVDDAATYVFVALTAGE